MIKSIYNTGYSSLMTEAYKVSETFETLSTLTWPPIAWEELIESSRFYRTTIWKLRLSLNVSQLLSRLLNKWIQLPENGTAGKVEPWRANPRNKYSEVRCESGACRGAWLGGPQFEPCTPESEKGTRTCSLEVGGTRILNTSQYYNSFHIKFGPSVLWIISIVTDDVVHCKYLITWWWWYFRLPWRLV